MINFVKEPTKNMGSMIDDGGIFATLVAQAKPLPKDFQASFTKFIIEVELNWLRPSQRDPSPSPGVAYSTFWSKNGNLQ